MKVTKKRILDLLKEEGFPSKNECNWIISKIGNKNKERTRNLLDVGCGYFHTFYLSEKLKNFKITGIDNDEHVIKSNIKFLNKSKIKDLNFILSNIYRFEPKIKFDYIISSRMIHYVFGKRRLFKRYYKLLNEGGKLLVSWMTKVW